VPEPGPAADAPETETAPPAPKRTRKTAASK
jgi:hypothetical protein